MLTNSPCRRRPTRSAQTARVVPSATPEGERLLRDLAFVLHLTSRVKSQMMADSDANHSSLALAIRDDSY
jgi:hypothetical protein